MDTKDDNAAETSPSNDVGCYLVRVLIDTEPYCGRLGFMWKEVAIPFVPFEGLALRLHDGKNEGWWDQVVIYRVEWNMSQSRFECDATIPCAPNGEKALDVIESQGWTNL